MAKIQFGDYLKGKKKQAAIYESGEALFERAKGKLEVDSMVVSPDYRVKNLEAAAELLKEAQGVPGADRLYSDTEKLIGEAKTAKKEADYQRACLHLSDAKDEYEYSKASGEFAALKGYRDSETKSAEAQKKSKSLNRRFQITRAIVLAAIVALACFIYLAYKGQYLNYAAGRMEGLGGKYQSAWGRLSKINVLDSQAQAAKYHELYLRQREASESKSLPYAKAGDTVSYAGEKWLVLERHSGKLLLICDSPSADGSFRGKAFNDGRGETSWADCTLRFYLNNAGLGAFTELERSALVDMKYTASGNERYGIPAPSETLTDKVRIFDFDDLKKYADVFEKPGVDMWLAAPGHDTTAAAFQSKSGTVVYYGDDASDSSLSACPVIKVDLRKLAAA